MQWFERGFEFSFPVTVYPNLLERWRGLIPRVEAKLEDGDADRWRARSGERWSAQENLGHIGDLEELWQARMADFATGALVLTPADLENKKSHAAAHNQHSLVEVASQVIAQRRASLAILEALEPGDFARTSRHPRLDQPMRQVDLLYFVAEHDDHHLARIHACMTGA